MDPFGETIQKQNPIYLGILGKTESATQNRIYEDVLHPLLSEWTRMPEKMIVSSEGTSSALLSIWAERNEVDCQVIEADYRKLGRRAGFLRDARIVKESTHLLIFLGPRSPKNQQLAEREAKKGKTVYTVDSKTYELSELTLSSPSSPWG